MGPETSPASAFVERCCRMLGYQKVCYLRWVSFAW